MKKKILFVLSVSLFSLVMIIYAHSQEYMGFVNTDAFKTPRRSPAVFRHDEHNKLAKIEECNVMSGIRLFPIKLVSEPLYILEV